MTRSHQFPPTAEKMGAMNSAPANTNRKPGPARRGAGSCHRLVGSQRGSDGGARTRPLGTPPAATPAERGRGLHVGRREESSCCSSIVVRRAARQIRGARTSGPLCPRNEPGLEHRQPQVAGLPDDALAEFFEPVLVKTRFRRNAAAGKSLLSLVQPRSDRFDRVHDAEPSTTVLNRQVLGY